jgi:glycosyltransferase involved in cell wall biosynthesis
MSAYNLSYIIATRNRLPFLKITLGKLISELQADEEIVVVDGDSTDGAKEYLRQLFETGKIHQFISEPDRNQGHAWNKGMLMAKGVIIKKIIDDDIYNYTAIRKCCAHMLQNIAIDVCISNSLESSLTNYTIVKTESRLLWYLKWRSGALKAFTFGDVHMLIRKSALSYVGLYDTQFKMIDWEYSLRICYLKANIAYYTGYNSMSVATPGNVSSTATEDLFLYEGKIGKLKYNYPGDGSDISLYSHIKIGIGKFLHRIKKQPEIEPQLPSESELITIYMSYYDKIKEYNDSGTWEFIV